MAFIGQFKSKIPFVSPFLKRGKRGIEKKTISGIREKGSKGRKSFHSLSCILYQGAEPLIFMMKLV